MSKPPGFAGNFNGSWVHIYPLEFCHLSWRNRVAAGFATFDASFGQYDCRVHHRANTFKSEEYYKIKSCSRLFDKR